ncbi:MAG TPA: iron ABC transporter permease [Symbiobacteriaceae bacterium]|nr:iron ABC transporter permease [Symbiobacteriaceae bacterium]
MRAIRGRRVIWISAIVLLVTLILAGGVGAVRIPPWEAIRILLSRLPGVDLTADWKATSAVIFWDIRLPRVLMGALVGIALSVAGAAYQGLFKNPLADPGILGVSAGAALGGAVAIAFLSRLQVSGVGTVPFFAFLGGIAAVTVVYRLAAVGRRVPVVGLLLAGVAVGSFSVSLVSLILFFTDRQARDAIVFWMMGGLGGANWEKVAWLLPYMASGIGALLFYWRELNALLLGEESALHLGVDVEHLKRVVLVAGTLLTAASVAFAGTIGFVGLVVPHIVRFLVGPDHRYLLPAAGVVGAIVVVLADTVARSTLPTEIPVGLVMAVLGGPFFLWLLRRRLKPAEA